MADIYIAWVPGLLEDPAALRELKSSGLITGIEMSRVHGNMENISKAGLQLSLHNPGLNEAANLANPDLLSMFAGSKGQRLLETIRETGAPFVGVHCGYS